MLCPHGKGQGALAAGGSCPALPWFNQGNPTPCMPTFLGLNCVQVQAGRRKSTIAVRMELSITACLPAATSTLIFVWVQVRLAHSMFSRRPCLPLDHSPGI